MLRDWFRKKAQKIKDIRDQRYTERTIARCMAEHARAEGKAKGEIFIAIVGQNSEAFVDILLRFRGATGWTNSEGKSVKEMLAEGLMDGLKDIIARQPTEFMSPVGRAVHFQNAEALEFFLACGASCEGKDENNSPSVSAAKWNDTDCLAVLKKYGADFNKVHGESWDSTPLMAASYLGKCEALEYLLDHGAKASVATPMGKDALNVAAQWDGIENKDDVRGKIHAIINGHPAKMQAIYDASVRTGRAVTLPKTIKLKP